jgi:hypothetical protein
MTIARLYLLDLGVTLVVSILVLAYLRGPLQSILTDLCATAERASFWTAFSIVTLLLVPLIFAMNYQPELESNASAVVEAAQQIQWALIGWWCLRSCWGS